MNQSIENIIYLIQQTDLDQTIKEILIRDLKTEGLNDFLREQIILYCSEGINRLDARISKAQSALQTKKSLNSTPVT